MQPLHLNENTVILDTETTGIKFDIAEICEIAIVDYAGNKVFRSLVKTINHIHTSATSPTPLYAQYFVPS